MRHGRAAQPHDAQEQRINRVLPILIAQRLERRRSRTARVRHQNVEPAESIDGLLHDARRIGGAAQIGDKRHHVGAGVPPQLTGRGLDRIGTARANRDRRAAGSKRARRRLAEALARGAHERDPHR